MTVDARRSVGSTARPDEHDARPDGLGTGSGVGEALGQGVSWDTAHAEPEAPHRGQSERTELRVSEDRAGSAPPEAPDPPCADATKVGRCRSGAERVDVHTCHVRGDWCAVSTKKYHQTVISHIRHGLYYVNLNAGAASVESSDGETQREIGVEAAGRPSREAAGQRTHL